MNSNCIVTVSDTLTSMRPDADAPGCVHFSTDTTTTVLGARPVPLKRAAENQLDVFKDSHELPADRVFVSPLRATEAWQNYVNETREILEKAGWTDCTKECDMSLLGYNNTLRMFKDVGRTAFWRVLTMRIVYLA